jgi:hypothetical protein
MRLALIPPYENANIIQHTDYQLLLPQCLKNRRYRAAYRKARRNGSYMILDNGAAEGIDTTPEALIGLARDMMVNEIVVPDTIGDMKATLMQAHDFYQGGRVTTDFNYMGVVQGSSWHECLSCIRGFRALPYITTLGIPRHLLDIKEDMRVHLVDHIRVACGDQFQLHLLGMNRKYTNELISYGRTYRRWGVRGIDTSAPFIYAMAGMSLAQHEKILERPKDYFDGTITSKDLTYTNLVIMKDWVYSNV